MRINGYLENFNGISYGWVKLDLNKPGIYIMSGDNGIGKTTFIEGVIFGTHEEVTFASGAMHDTYLNLRHQLIAYLPQNIAQPFYTVETYLKTAIQNDQAKCLDYLKKFDFEATSLKRPFKELSGGEQIKIAFISALMKETPYLFLDEPTNNLDDASVETLKVIIRRLSESKVVVIVSHDPRMRDLATSTITFSAGKITQVNSCSQQEVAQIKKVANVTFNPFLVAKKLFISPYNGFTLFLKLVFLIMIVMLNGVFLSMNYTTEDSPTGGPILASAGFMFENSFNEVVINELGITPNETNETRFIEWGDIPQLASLNEVEHIVMTDFIYWLNIYDNMAVSQVSDGLLSEVFVVNPPHVIWEGYDVWHGLLSPRYLSQGRFPVDGYREVALSTGLLQAQFGMTRDAAYESIGTHIYIGEQAHEIVGILYSHLAVISHHPAENFGFYTFDVETYEAFTEPIITLREGRDWWNVDGIEPIFIFPTDGDEEIVLTYLLTEFPIAELYSELFSITWMRGHNSMVVSELFNRNLIQISILAFITMALTFNMKKLLKPELATWEVYYIDQVKIKASYLKWILVGGGVLAILTVVISLFLSTFWLQMLWINLFNVAIIMCLEMLGYLLAMSEPKKSKTR